MKLCPNSTLYMDQTASDIQCPQRQFGLCAGALLVSPLRAGAAAFVGQTLGTKEMLTGLTGANEGQVPVIILSFHFPPLSFHSSLLSLPQK